MKTINEVATKTATQWRKRAKRNRKYRKLINLKNKLILYWFRLID
jgi:hypothetical protein